MIEMLKMRELFELAVEQKNDDNEEDTEELSI